MRQITLRFPAVGTRHLQVLCLRHGITIRGLFEAATMISLEDELDPDRSEMQVALWGVARLLERSEAYRTKERDRIVIYFRKSLADQLRESCERFGVSQNAALALVVLPWPEGAGTDIPQEYRRQTLERIVERARYLDFTRRGGLLSRS